MNLQKAKTLIEERAKEIAPLNTIISLRANKGYKWAHLTTEARDPLLQQYFEEIGDPICAESCTCSKCGSVLMDEMIWM